MKKFHCILFALTAFLYGCQPPIPSQSLWRGTVPIHDGRTLEFTLDLNLETLPPTGAFIVGDERTVVPEVVYSGDSVHMVISEYGAALRGRWDGSQLRGRYFRYRRDTTSIEFAAKPGITQPPSASHAPTLALVGTYRLFQKKGEGLDTSISAKFWMRGDSVFGSFIQSDGDVGLLAGRQVGDTVFLHRFTGWQLLYYELRRNGLSWDALSFIRNLPPTRFTLEPRPGSDPSPVALKTTRAGHPGKRFRFNGVTSDGRILTDQSPDFAGKYLIVDIMGTWCHNCLDAAPVLQNIADEYKDKDLVVVGLAFELSPDTLLARKNLSLYQKRYGLTYPLLFCGTTEPKDTDPVLHAQLKDFYAYPTTLFIGRDGVMKEVHVGFRGLGTGDGYQREVQTMYHRVEQLLTK